ncbi:MAG: hypothetical protein SVM80_10790 [Halobacteriota archaeon]|nr:hypothetical protein [Halobacteriota archaeon]
MPQTSTSGFQGKVKSKRLKKFLTVDNSGTVIPPRKNTRRN